MLKMMASLTDSGSLTRRRIGKGHLEVSFKIEVMKESLKEILQKLSDRDLALVVAGEIDALSIPEEDKSILKNLSEVASITATEILATRKGFVVEETELLRIKKEGKLLGHVPLYQMGNEYFIIYEDRVIKVNIAKPEEAEKPKPRKKVPKGGIKLP